MGSLLASHTNSRDNNFNLLRFLAASLVLFAHNYPLTATHGEPLFGGLKLGHVAVDIFFITSGLLVTRSLLTRGNVAAFAWARFVRIYPALILAVLLCAFPLGLFFTTQATGEYLKDGQVLRFVVKNASLVLGSIAYNLPGVFADNPYPKAVNGSLWTLPWEIRMYALLGIMGLGSLFLPKQSRTLWIERAVLALALVGLIASLTHQFNGWAGPVYNGNGLRLLSMFFVGGSFYVLRNRVTLNHFAFAGAALALIASQAAVGLVDSPWAPRVFAVLYMTLLAYVILYIAYIPGGPLRSFNKLGDYSYGLYIYAFPVQQAIAATQPDIGVWSMFGLASVLTLLLAVASWYLLEKPMLRQKDAYKRFLPASWT